MKMRAGNGSSLYILLFLPNILLSLWACSNIEAIIGAQKEGCYVVKDAVSKIRHIGFQTLTREIMNLLMH